MERQSPDSRREAEEKEANKWFFPDKNESERIWFKQRYKIDEQIWRTDRVETWNVRRASRTSRDIWILSASSIEQNVHVDVGILIVRIWLAWLPMILLLRY